MNDNYITNNNRFKYNGTGWEADNLAEKTTHIFAKGTAYGGVFQNGDVAQGDVFAIEGSRVVRINGIDAGVPGGRGMALTVIEESSGTVLSQEVFDIYSVDARRTDLANALAAIGPEQLWVLTSFDAINPNAALDAQMASMGSILLVNDGNEYSVFKNGGYRSTYAAVGRGQKLIKEDGSTQGETVYKRKGVIDLKV